MTTIVQPSFSLPSPYYGNTAYNNDQYQTIMSQLSNGYKVSGLSAGQPIAIQYIPDPSSAVIYVTLYNNYPPSASGLQSQQNLINSLQQMVSSGNPNIIALDQASQVLSNALTQLQYANSGTTPSTWDMQGSAPVMSQTGSSLPLTFIAVGLIAFGIYKYG